MVALGNDPRPNQLLLAGSRVRPVLPSKSLPARLIPIADDARVVNQRQDVGSHIDVSLWSRGAVERRNSLLNQRSGTTQIAELRPLLHQVVLFDVRKYLVSPTQILGAKPWSQLFAGIPKGICLSTSGRKVLCRRLKIVSNPNQAV